jgi:tRNA(fMet)-specific endonuclease VapC
VKRSLNGSKESDLRNGRAPSWLFAVSADFRDSRTNENTWSLRGSLSMRFLLDACVLSDFAGGQPPTMERVKSAAPEDLAASVVTRMENQYGLLLNPLRARRLKRPLEGRSRRSPCVHTQNKMPRRRLLSARVSSAADGRSGRMTFLTAGTAVAHDLTLVTSNLREFEQVSDLRIEDWRS